MAQDSLDEDTESEVDAEQAQAAELIRRMRAFDGGQIKLVDADEARSRVVARLRSVRGR